MSRFSITSIRDTCDVVLQYTVRSTCVVIGAATGIAASLSLTPQRVDEFCGAFFDAIGAGPEVLPIELCTLGKVVLGGVSGGYLGAKMGDALLKKWFLQKIE